MTEANGAVAGKNSYVGASTEQKVFRVTAAYNYSPFKSNELALQKVICSVFLISYKLQLHLQVRFLH